MLAFDGHAPVGAVAAQDVLDGVEVPAGAVVPVRFLVHPQEEVGVELLPVGRADDREVRPGALQDQVGDASGDAGRP